MLSASQCAVRQAAHRLQQLKRHSSIIADHDTVRTDIHLHAGQAHHARTAWTAPRFLGMSFAGKLDVKISVGWKRSEPPRPQKRLVRQFFADR